MQKNLGMYDAGGLHFKVSLARHCGRGICFRPLLPVFLRLECLDSELIFPILLQLNPQMVLLVQNFRVLYERFLFLLWPRHSAENHVDAFGCGVEDLGFRAVRYAGTGGFNLEVAEEVGVGPHVVGVDEDLDGVAVGEEAAGDMLQV